MFGDRLVWYVVFGDRLDVFACGVAGRGGLLGFVASRGVGII